MLWLNYAEKQAHATKDVDLCAPRTHPLLVYIHSYKKISHELYEVYEERIRRIKCYRTVILQSFPGQMKRNLLH